MENKNIIGKTFGEVLVLYQKKENGKIYCFCRCLRCGREWWTRKDSLTSGRTTSCGCKTRYRSDDIAGKVFGNLKAMRFDHKEGSYEYWLFKCLLCGREKVIAKYKVVEGKVKSCGCLFEKSKNGFSKTVKSDIQIRSEKDKNLKTKISSIESDTPLSTNNSGFRGVSFDKSRGKFIAQIVFQYQRYYLGRYSKKEDAKKAYDLAKEILVNNSNSTEIKAAFERLKNKSKNIVANMLTLKQYSELYHVNLKNLRRKAAEGKISGAVKIDGRWMIPKKNNK
jgi:hypothetical protein